MITINLLPAEYRVQQATSSKQMLVVIASACIGLLPGIYFLYVHFVSLANMQTAVQQATAQREDLRKYEQENDKLNGLINSFSVRNTAIDAVKALRVSFSRKLFQFSNLLQQKSHQLWITNLSITPKARVQETAGRRGSSGISQTNTSPQFAWKSGAIYASDFLNQPNAFYADIKQYAEFYRDIANIEVFRYTINKFPVIYEQKIGWRFDLNMTMQISPLGKDEPKSKEPNKP